MGVAVGSVLTNEALHEATAVLSRGVQTFPSQAEHITSIDVISVTARFVDPLFVVGSIGEGPYVLVSVCPAVFEYDKKNL